MTSTGKPDGPPYPPTKQALGETPSILPDIPINAVFLTLFIICGALNMIILKVNSARGKKFGINGMLFGFCMTRILATTFRIVWAVYPHNIQIGMVAMIFVYAGVILLFIANLFFAQRLVRAQHPYFGWRRPVGLVLPVLLAIMVATVICLIVSVVLEFYSLDAGVKRATRDIQCYGASLYAVVAFLPLPIVAISTAARRLPSIRNTRTTDRFGQGKMRAKVAIVLVSAVFLTLGAAYRAGTTLREPVSLLRTDISPPQPAPRPSYFSKAAFYVFDFTIEICIVIFWLVVRIDKRFYIPDGAKGPFSYGGGFTFAGESGNEKPRLGTVVGGSQSNRDSTRHLTAASSRSSLRTSRNSRVSWGGLSRDDIDTTVGEDGVMVAPYLGLDRDAGADYDTVHGYAGLASTAADVGVAGVESEMGWDSKSGKWALRPIAPARQALLADGTRP